MALAGGDARQLARDLLGITESEVSAAFEGKSRVARQRMVNAALAELLKDRVHALAMVTA